MTKLMYSVREVAEAVGLSQQVIRAAIKQEYVKGPEKDMKRLPRLPATQPTNRNDFRIRATDLQAWIEQLPDA